LHLRNTLSVLTTSGAFIRFSCQIPAESPSAPSSPAKAAADPSSGGGAGAAGASSNPFDFDVDFAQVQKRRERARAAKESAREEGKERRAEEK
jgi:hypothetical protein